MFVNKVDVLTMARAMARHAAADQTVIARNVANADTPGYRAQRLNSFAAQWREADTSMQHSRVGHLADSRQFSARPRMIDAGLGPNGNSVSLETEIAQAALARQSHELALTIQRSLGGAIRATLARR